MRSSTVAVVGSLLACCGTLAGAQASVDRSFIASGRDCSSVRWSDEALTKYPKIVSACQQVIERGGKHYVRFDGTLTQNIDNGARWRVNFKDAGVMTLTPPPQLQVYVKGRPVSPQDMQPGDALTFYVAEDRLAAQFYSQGASPDTTAEHVVVPILYTEEPAAASPPAIRRLLLALSVLGVMLIAFLVMVNLRRRIVRRL